MVDQESARGSEGRQALLIESDEAYRVVIAACMRLAGCQVEVVEDFDVGLRALERRSTELVVWGGSTSGAHGRAESISEVRLRSDAPLVLVAGSFDTAQVDLETGADQWVPKPFVPGTLVGSVRAALRKASASIASVTSRVEIHGMVLDGKRRRLTFSGSQTTLTRQEWDLLSILVSHPDRFLGAREILRLGWRAGRHGPEQLRTYVHRLRRKLEPMDLPCRLASRHGEGYCLSFESTAPVGPMR
jgi:DNA-binding response OmpR family regulator